MENDELRPLWQPAGSIRRQDRHWAVVKSSLLIILLPVVFIVIPFYWNKQTNPPIQSQRVMSWDSLNIILVIFAILCGIFAKPKPEDDLPTKNTNHDTQTSISNTNTNTGLLRRSKTMMHHQYSHPHQQQHRITRLRRTLSSDPYITTAAYNHFRFFDDLDITTFYPHHQTPLPQPHAQPLHDAEITQLKDIQLHNFVLHTRGELPSPTFSPPPANQRRTFQTISRREQVPPPSPPPRREEKRSLRKRMNATKEIATAIAHFYSQRKRKRRLKSTRNFDDHSQIQSQFVPPPPPPPLPPHPPSVFHNWFKKGSIHSFTSIPTPPPPPTRQKPVISARKPPLPRRREIGNESPMNGLVPPPAAQRVAGGGYVKVEGAQRSRCGSAEMDGKDEEMSSSGDMYGQDGEKVCPSPDLNVKADSFIARHHDGWRLEKLNSWREKLKNPGNGPTSRPII